MKRVLQFLIVGTLIMIFIAVLFLLFSTFKSEPAMVPAFKVLVHQSELFEQRVPFPTRDNRISIIAGNDAVKQTEIVRQAQNVHPLMHKKVGQLIDDFLILKRNYGSTIEKKLYANMSRESFIDRLLSQRPLMFMTGEDEYLLRDGKTKGHGGFQAIGTAHEKIPLTLEHYLSYDEMQIAALIGVSVPTFFINNGDRNNAGKAAIFGTYEPQGIYVGLVGARFEKPGLMEWQHIIITPEQNTPEHGYGAQSAPKNPMLQLWADFYGVTFPTFDEAKTDSSGRYIPFNKGEMYFDTAVYKERMRLVIEPFLIDADQCAAEQHTKAYVHAVGLGLGVWQKIPEQATLLVDVYADVINNNKLSHIADIDFSWFPSYAQSCGGIKNNERFITPTNNLTIHFSKRNPADILKHEDSGKLLVACYAWDSNAFPGNEYWVGYLTASGDPAAACCSSIAELQNPEINKHVSAEYIHIWPNILNIA